MTITIIPFDSRYARAFTDLNKAWLEEYFWVEPNDEILLENCKEAIIDMVRYIFSPSVMIPW